MVRRFLTRAIASGEPAEDVAMKILIAIHGNEPPGWARDLPGILALPSGAVVRFLPVVDVAAPESSSRAAV